MRLRSLALRPFGSHEKTELSFETRGVLHIVYGANEAGKSTTRRAIVSLLYGIDERSPDGHRFGNKNLRIAAVVEGDDGKTLSVVRRKGRKDTLTDEANAPIADALWAKMLAGVGRDAYERAYGLDHELLRRGAEALLAGDVDLGESLFQASTGTVNLGRFRASLADRAEAIYSDRARTKQLNTAFADYDEARKKVREWPTSPEVYQAAKAALANVEAERGRVEAERDGLLRERAANERTVALGKLFASHKNLTTQLADLGVGAASLGDDVKGVNADDFQRRRGEASSQRAEIEKHAAERAAAKERALAIEARLGPTPPAVTAQALHELEGTLPKLAREPALLADRIARERVQFARFTADLAALAESEEKLSVPQVDVDGVRAALADAEPVLARAARLPELAAELSRAKAEADALPDVAPDTKVPPAAALEPFEREYAALSQSLVTNESDVARYREQAIRVNTDLGALTAEFAPPSEEELARARADRDALLAEAMKEPRKLDALAAAVREADALADRMRRESTRVAERARLAAEIAALARAAEEAAATAASVDERRRALAKRFAALFEGAPPPIEAGRAFVESVVRARALASSVNDLTRRIADLEVEAARAKDSLARHVGRTGVGLSGLVVLAREKLLEANAAVTLQRAREEERRRLSRGRAESEAALADLTRAQEAAQAALERALLSLGLTKDGREEVAIRRIDDLRELGRANAVHANAEARIDALTAQVRELDALTIRLHRTLGLPDEDDADRRALAVGRKLRALADAEQARKALENQLADVELRIGGHGADPAAPLDPRDVADADQRLFVIAEELEHVERELPRLHQRIGGERAGLEQMERKEALTLSAALDAEQALAKIADLAAKYARLSIAQMILDERIEAHRAESEHEVLTRASALVAKITRGSVMGLRASYDDDLEHPMLVAMRPNGDATPLDGLSQGTKDQLYLALRVASLERVARSGAALPVLLDDVIVHFDEERTKAAFPIIADLAKMTQVIFFTHHNRTVELAREALAPADLSIATLG